MDGEATIMVGTWALPSQYREEFSLDAYRLERDVVGQDVFEVREQASEARAYQTGFAPLSYHADDVAWMEYQDLLAKRICTIFGITVQELGL